MSSRASFLKLAAVACALLFTLAWSKPATVGPPWISLEMPANPLDPTTRGAALVIHTFHHEKPIGFPVSGTAEGLVNGERRSLPLEFTSTSRPGVYALKQQWPAEGDWVLAIATQGRAEVSLVVELGPNGGVQADDFFDWPMNLVAVRSARVVQGSVDKGEIETALLAMSRSE